MKGLYKMFLEDSVIIDNIQISDDKYLIRVKSNESYQHSKAGRFSCPKAILF